MQSRSGVPFVQKKTAFGISWQRAVPQHGLSRMVTKALRAILDESAVRGGRARGLLFCMALGSVKRCGMVLLSTMATS
jgi:hypothetical protein